MASFERIIPILVYEDIPSAHDFLVDAFGFVSGGVQRTPLVAWSSIWTMSMRTTQTRVSAAPR